MHPGPYNPPPGAYPPPGPYGRNAPRYGHPGGGSRRGGCSCLKVYCCCCCCLFITIVLFLAAIAITLVIIKPQVPKYSIDDFAVKTFNLTPDFNLKSHIVVTVKADNPNKYIEFEYGHAKQPTDNFVKVMYSNVELCSGAIPDFKQPKSNVTMMNIDLKGDLKKDNWAEGSGESLADKLKNNDKIPLVVSTKLPVRIKIASMEIENEPTVISLNCTMNVKNFGTGKKVEISDAKYEVGLYINKKFIKLNGFKLF